MVASLDVPEDVAERHLELLRIVDVVRLLVVEELAAVQLHEGLQLNRWDSYQSLEYVLEFHLLLPRMPIV